MTISILLADDHPVVRRGMRTLLEAESDFWVVGEAGDGLDAIRLVETLHPDVLVLDLMMAGSGGLDVLRIVPQRSPQTRTVVLSMYCSSAFVAESLKNGAVSYVLKGSTGDDLIRAVRETASGRRFLSPPVSEVAINAYIQQTKAGPVEAHETLTPRERAVLQLVAEGLRNAEIARRLHIGQRTVENHRARLMRKLGLRNHSDLVRHAIRRGLISLAE